MIHDKQIDKTQLAVTLTVKDLETIVMEAVMKVKEDFEEQPNSFDLLGLENVMLLLNKSRSTIFSWKKQGILKPYYIGGSLYFKKSDLEKLIKIKK